MGGRYNNTKRIPREQLNYNKQYRNSYYNQQNRRNSLQDNFLEAAKNSEIVLEIYMKNEGVKHGVVLDYDNWCVLIWSVDEQYLIFKSGIMSIKPQENLDMQPEYQNKYYKYAYVSEQTRD